MNTILALDPGSTRTGWCLFDLDNGVPVKWGDDENGKVTNLIERDWNPVVCEFPYPRGQTPSWQLFETCEWAGRFHQVVSERAGGFIKMDRDDIKKCICGSSRAKDPQVRKALIDIFGGERCLSIGKCPACKGKGGSGRGKKRALCGACDGSGAVPPGLLSTMTGDAWQALAVAVTFHRKGASKSAQELQVDRKARKADKKVRDLELLIDLESKAVVLAGNPTPKTERQRQQQLKSLAVLNKRISSIKQRYKIESSLNV